MNLRILLSRVVLLGLVIVGWPGCGDESDPADAPVETGTEGATGETGSPEAGADTGSSGSGAADGPPRVLGTVPEFTLTDQTDTAFGSSDLAGKVWVANFIFTRCRATCPTQTARMSELHATLARHPHWSNLRLASFSVDPEFDTTVVLASFARRYRADDDHWKFLTGDRAAIHGLCKDGFRLPVEEDPSNSASPIAHTSQLVVVDAEGKIRGYFDGMTGEGIAQVTDTIDQLFERVEVPADAVRRFTKSPSLDPKWMKTRQAAQLKTAEDFQVFCDFKFTDRLPETGITWVHGVSPDGARDFKIVHYDHGNGVAVADVDGDGRLDLYLVSQVGPNALYRNLGDGTFEDITEQAGVAVDVPCKITASFADIDNDGDQDLYVTSVRFPNQLFENDGTGKFTDITEHSGLGYNGHSSTPVFFDYDRDGLVDVFLTVVGVYTTDQRAPASDVMVDGDHKHWYYVAHKDAFSGHIKEDRTETSILYRNLGGNKFEDVSEATGLVDTAWTGDASPIDVNQDGWMDLYILNMQGHDEYWENQEGKFVKKSREVFPKTSWGAMGVQVMDFENDGLLDIYVTDMHSDMMEDLGPNKEKTKMRKLWPDSILRDEGMSIFGNSFYRNLGNGQFEEVSDAINAENYWPWGHTVADLNADGFEDVFIASSMNFHWRYAVNSVLLNENGERFRDAEFIVGVEPRRDGRTHKEWYRLDCDGVDKEHEDCQVEGVSGTIAFDDVLGSRTSVAFDIDDDGDLDLVTGDFASEPCILFSNLSEQKDIRYLKVALVGTASNRNGLGAIVKVKTGDRVFTRLHDGKSGYLSQSAMPLYFGLGDADAVDEITVNWPSGKVQTLEGPIEPNALLTITEE